MCDNNDNVTGTKKPFLIHFNLCTVHITSIVITQRLTAVMSDDEFFPRRDRKCVWFKLGLYRTHYERMSTHVKCWNHIYLFADFIFQPWMALIRFFSECHLQQTIRRRRWRRHFFHALNLSSCTFVWLNSLKDGKKMPATLILLHI